MPRTPLTEDQKNVLRKRLADARATRAAKQDAELEKYENPVVVAPQTTEIPMVSSHDEVVESPTTAANEPSATPMAPTSPMEVTLRSVVDKQPLEACIRDICWRGQTITITQRDYLSVVREVTPETPTFMTIVKEVERLLREGGYQFVREG
jgi:hypothetical protein